jgi:hypothetical protein
MGHIAHLSHNGSVEDSLEFISVFLHVRYHLPLEKAILHEFNKFEFPSPKDAFSQVWLKLAQWFVRRRF